MATSQPSQKLQNLSPSQIDANPENPRLIFRQDEMESLLLSIDKHGVQVPVTVYREGERYHLIDGERRWRCAKKLGLRTIPALVQSKPTELQNLVLMYNIHALREQWDYYTIASKLERVIDLFTDENGYRPGEVILSELTGLTRGAIRRCYLIIDLPDRFKEMLVKELDRPKSQQRLSEDFFIEMEKSLKTVSRRIPEYEPKLDVIRDTLIDKFQNKVITAVTDFRQLSKIATAVDTLGVAQRHAKRALDRVFDPNEPVGIKVAYQDTVAFEYGERKAIKSVSSLIDFIDDVEQKGEEENLDEEFLEKLRQLYDRITALLEH